MNDLGRSFLGPLVDVVVVSLSYYVNFDMKLLIFLGITLLMSDALP